jgi:hypothetical protein
MDLRPVAPGGVDPAVAQARAERARVRPQDGDAFAGALDAAQSDYPPPEVWREVDQAARAYEVLKSQGRELHFDTDDETGKLKIEVRSSDGEVLRTIPATEAIAIAGGAPA